MRRLHLSMFDLEGKVKHWFWRCLLFLVPDCWLIVLNDGHQRILMSINGYSLVAVLLLTFEKHLLSLTNALLNAFPMFVA